MTKTIVPFSLKDSPALIERLLPVQKLSAEVFKERNAGPAQALTSLGNFWKGRKPLILNKACILGCLLPATENVERDLESLKNSWLWMMSHSLSGGEKVFHPRIYLLSNSISNIYDYFQTEPPNALPNSSPIDWSIEEFGKVKITWKENISPLERRRLEAEMLPQISNRERVNQAKRPDEVLDTVYDHIWEAVNQHIGTNAQSFPELIEQLGIMRYGHRPRVADTFCGSGQIPFEAARLGCDVYAADLNPVSAMLTWGAFNIVGATQEKREALTFEMKAEPGAACSR